MTSISRTLPGLALAAALAAGTASAQAPAKPQYGGTLNVGTVYVTRTALSWDGADWNWKFNHDAGQMYEQLFAADLSKAQRNGGRQAFAADAWVPSDAMRGELAERWTWTDPLTLTVQLRKGVKFPAKEGVMAERELVAEDVVYAYTRMDQSPKKIPTYFDHIAKVEATDRHTVVFRFKSFNAEWDYRWGWGYYSSIVPREVVEAGAGDWRKANGTGPFLLSNFVQGNANTYVKNPIYWDKESIAGQAYQLPFVDGITYRTIKDESSQLTALRTGRLDILETIRWTSVDELRRNAPALKWKRFLATSANYLAMRVDQKPFDDIRVRRALNMAVNKQEVVQQFYGGNAELFSFPMSPAFEGYYEPLSAMPPEVQQLFTYDPEGAKKLLAEAGHAKGFSFKVQVCACEPNSMELLQLLAGYLQKVGVRMEIQSMEYAPFLSAMTSKTNAPGYYMSNGFTNPTTSLRKNFLTGQTWNAAQWADPKFDAQMEAIYAERDEPARQAKIKQATRDILAGAPYIFMPTPYYYAAWWPWVKNYDGELFAGAARPGPIYARMWIDQELKQKMGFK